MASDLSTYLGNKIVRWLGGNAMPSAPASLELSLWDGDPKGAGVEITDDVSAGGRITVAWTVPAVGLDNELTNSAEVDFGNSDNDVELSHVALHDDGGNFIASKALPGGPFTVTTGSQVKFNIGGITFTIGS